MRQTQLTVLLIAMFIGPAFFNETASAQDKAKIVFISGKPSHGPMVHGAVTPLCERRSSQG